MSSRKILRFHSQTYDLPCEFDYAAYMVPNDYLSDYLAANQTYRDASLIKLSIMSIIGMLTYYYVIISIHQITMSWSSFPVNQVLFYA